MKKKSRTEYSVMNTTVAFAAQATAILMGFFTRVIFTRMLSEGYVGINGLFNDILNILSLSELGVGTAITYALYGPIAKKDIKKQQILMRMFRTFYRATAGVVLLVGLALLPFLDVLMKERPDVDHLTLIYLLYLFKSVASYLLIYKKTLVDAHQMNYITVLYHNGFLVLQDVCQIVILLLTGNFILFLVIGVVCTIAGNICMSRTADRLFPYLKEECREKLPEAERKDILKNVKPLSAKMIILYDGEEDVDECNIIEAPEGDYLCMFYVGNFWNREESIEKMLTYMKENDLVLAGDVLQMQWVDFAITDNLDDISYEFQIPVKPLFSEKR